MTITKTILAWHSLFRTEHALIALVGVLVGELLVSRSFSLALLFPTVGPVLIVLAAFALNDYFGYETDNVNKRSDRPLVAGAIKRSHALYVALVLFLVGLAATYLVNFTVFAISLAYVFLSLIYDNFLKKLPLAGNVFIALSMAGPFIYGNLVVSPQLSNAVVLVSSIAFLVGIGRELLITLRDVKGDKKIRAITLPMLIGGRKTAVLSASLVLVSILLSLIPIFSPILLPLSQTKFFGYFFFILPCDFLLLLSSYKALKSQDELTLKKCRNYTLAALCLGVLGFLAIAML